MPLILQNTLNSGTQGNIQLVLWVPEHSHTQVIRYLEDCFTAPKCRCARFRSCKWIIVAYISFMLARWNTL